MYDPRKLKHEKLTSTEIATLKIFPLYGIHKMVRLLAVSMWLTATSIHLVESSNTRFMIYLPEEALCSLWTKYKSTKFTLMNRNVTRIVLKFICCLTLLLTR